MSFKFPLGRAGITTSNVGLIFCERHAKGLSVDSNHRYNFCFGWNSDVWLGEREPTFERDDGSGEGARVGLAGNIPELTEAALPDDEYLVWGMTAVAAKLLEAKAAYRSPDDNGFVYIVYCSIGFATSDGDTTSQPKLVECTAHGTGLSTKCMRTPYLDSCPGVVLAGARCAACNVSSKSRVSGTKRTSQKLKSRCSVTTVMKDCVRNEGLRTPKAEPDSRFHRVRFSGHGTKMTSPSNRRVTTAQ